MKEPKIIGKSTFKSRVTRDTAYGRLEDYGVVQNTMTLRKVDDKHLSIEWIVGSDKKDEIDAADIGILLDGRKVIDIDGVFDLPKEAVELLNKYGYDTKEVEPPKE